MSAYVEAITAAEVAAWTGGALTGDPARVLRGVSTDTRTLVPGNLFFALAGAADGHAFVPAAIAGGAGGVVVGPGFEGTVAGVPAIRVADTTRALGDAARGLRDRRGDLVVVGITGSAGKTTTKELTARVLIEALGDRVLVTEANYNNHIGVPWTLFRLAPRHTHAVIEMGMNHPGEIRELVRIARPRIAVVTNVHPVHLEFLGTIEAVAAAKAEILEGLGASDTAVLNADDPRVIAMAEGRAFRVVTFGTAPGATVRARSITPRGEEGTAIEAEVDGRPLSLRTPLLGAHNAINALAACAVGHALGLPRDTMARAVAGVFPGAKRTRIVALPSGAKAIDDCYNANPASMELALALLTQIARGARAFAALGDMFELGDHAPEAHRRVGRVAAKAGLAGLVAIGAHAELVIEEARAAGLPRAAGVVAEGPAEAVAVLKGWLRAGDYVLVKGSRGMRMERVLSGLAGEG